MLEGQQMDLRDSSATVQAEPLPTPRKASGKGLGRGAGNGPGKRTGAFEGVQNGPQNVSADTSILIYEVKSVANCVEQGENAILGKKLARATLHKVDALRFLDFLRERDSKRAEKLRSCASWLLYNQYLESGDVRLASGIFCQQPLLCGFCASGRSARQSQALHERIVHVMGSDPFQKAYMVTLTMRSQDRLAPMVDAFWTAWGTMVQRRRNTTKGLCSSVMGLMSGGVVSGEAKRGRGGKWHYHGHGLFLSSCVDRYVPVWERLKREWSAVIGQSSSSVQFEPIKEVGGTESAVREVCKYASKWEPGEYSDRWEAFEALTRVRRVRCFGSLYGVKLPEEVTDDLSDKEAEEFIERAFRYGADGYYETKHAVPDEVFRGWNEGHVITTDGE